MNDCIILTFTDSKYLEIFNIFYNNFKKLNLDLLVVSLDDIAFNSLSERGIKTIYKQYEINDLKSFWEFRLNIINETFKENKKNIIHTDSDCFWFKNILEKINDIKDDYDIIGSIAYGLPKNIVDKMGFVLCCGFYFIKYTEKNSSIFDKIKMEKISSIDDQILFNNYLYNNKIRIENTDNGIIYKTIVLNDDTKVGIVKNDIISRIYSKDLYCFHPCLKRGTISEKILRLKSMAEEPFL